MKPIALTVCVLCITISGVFAQTPAQSPGPAAGSEAQSPGINNAAGNAKELRERCRADADGKGLKGPAKRAAVQECFAKLPPDLAAAAQCRKQGKDKGLADQELRVFVRSCRKCNS